METLAEEYESCIEPLVEMVRHIIEGRSGVVEEARALLFMGEHPLGGRLYHLRRRIERASEKEEGPKEVKPRKDYLILGKKG